MDYGVVFPAGVHVHGDVAIAEKSGFTHAWLYDSQMLFSDPYAAMCLSANATSTIKLGTGVTNPSSRIAPVTANSIATVNELAPGRTILGIGTGNTARRTVGMPAARLEVLRDHVRVCRGLLAGETVDYTEGDRHRKIRFLNPEGDWYNIKEKIPIYIAASGPKSLQLAGEIADGVILFGAVSPVLIDFVLNHVRIGAERAGRDPDSIYKLCMTAFHLTEPGEPLETSKVRQAVGPFVASSTNIFALSSPDPSDLPAELRDDIVAFRDIYKVPDAPIETRHLKMYEDYLLGFKKEHEPVVTEKIMRATSLTGTPDEVIDAIQNMKKAGIDQVAIQPIIDNKQTVETFAREIISRIK
ncbi:MAG: LLM class flavin-dependent oxidoreductase [Rhodospirillales bacterium]|nr:LLM class flavin-dependent oxidoreductase [Rhodospirillales bacterium]